MDRTTLQQKLVHMLEENRGEKLEKFDESLNLRTELGLDSIDLVTLLIEVQQQLGVNLTVADVQPINLVSELLDLLQARLAVKAAA